MGWYTDDDRPQKKRRNISAGGRILLYIILAIAFVFVWGACIAAFGFAGVFLGPGLALLGLHFFLSIFGSSRW